MLDECKQRRIDVTVFPGDFFTNARPAPRQVLAVARLFHAFETVGIRVIGFPGNHDCPGAGQPGPCDLVAAMGDPWWSISEPTVVAIAGAGAYFAILPYCKPAALNADASDPTDAAVKLSQALLDIARGLRAQCELDLPKVLCGHWTIGGSVTSSNQVLGGTEPQLPLGELLGMGWDAVLFGHIHKPQMLYEKPFVGYAGALQRCDFGEERDPRGFWIVDLDDGSHEWVDLPAREFLTIGKDLTNAGQEEIDHFIDWDIAGVDRKGDDYLLLPDAAGKIVRVKYTATEEAAGMIDHGRILQAVQNAVPEYFAGIFPDIIRSDRSREASVTETTSPLEALGKWLVQRDIGADLQAKVIAEATELIKEAQA
jgi:exonuclease SbcD